MRHRRPHPEASSIVLSLLDQRGRTVNGLLHPYQLAQLHLGGSTVVLSACETGLGKQVIGEGLAGLSTSLFYAGAAQLVLTLTAVEDEGSSYFLSKVYNITSVIRRFDGTGGQAARRSLLTSILVRSITGRRLSFWDVPLMFASRLALQRI
jgi:hypothetical protein